MFPHHCKEVSVKTVDFQLTSANIRAFLKGKRAYLRTKYFVFRSGESWAVASVTKSSASEVLQEIRSVLVLALPSETSYVEDPSLDVLSASAMGAIREARKSKCVVVKGKAEHVSFFIDEPPKALTVFDVVPPHPSKLETLVECALESDLQDVYIKYKVVTKDLNELAAGVRSGITMYPCRASGLKAGRRVMFLDETPELRPEEIADVTLIGCSLSARIFKAVYGSDPRLINMCPKDLARESGIEGKVLIKCCKVKEGCHKDGDVFSVPWGARAADVSLALRRMFS